MTAALEVSGPAVTAGSTSGVDSRKDPFSLEHRGWTPQGVDCAPKLAALASLAQVLPPEPVARVTYTSRGNLLILAGADPARARGAAAALDGALHVTVLARERAAGVPYASWAGQLASLTGHLGQFDAVIAGLRTSEAGGANPQPTQARFDLVLDFSGERRFEMRQPPQGYFPAPGDDAALAAVVAELREAVGEFEKPRFFSYRENICAHSRSQVEGCNACIDICSTQAIASDGDKVRVDPHLCMGCGACATVCPSGAMGYQFPRPAERGAQLRALLGAYRAAGGAAPCVVFQDGQAGRELLARAGLPARALPVESWHVASTGLDLLLPAIAFGATNVVVLASPTDDAEYRAALRAQMRIGQVVLEGLGYAGSHFLLLEADGPQAVVEGLARLAPAEAPAQAATFHVSNDKRTAIEFAIEHLARHAPRPAVESIALPAGAPFGEVRVDREKCTLCLACVGACPESALMDGSDKPLLKFLERNCVQCGLCEATCPEAAITLVPRLLLTPAVREARVLNETQPFHCVRCSKPFGTRQMVEAMMGRLSGHAMFAGGEALKRLQMCADCRVVDMMAGRNELSIHDVDA